MNQLHTVPMTEMEKSIYDLKEKSPVVYTYESPESLRFELSMRAHIVNAAVALHNSQASFATFEKSRCNEQLWTRLPNGGFQLKRGVLPSEGIQDIFRQGHLYAFECATAMIIVLYRAVLDKLGSQAFDTYFRDLVLYDWQYDSDLKLLPIYNNQEAYPGDIVYFENPDHLPELSEWQGENAVVLDSVWYYGHGIGIKTANEMVAVLNSKRKPGSMTSAYLSDLVLQLDFEYMRKLAMWSNALGVQPFRREPAIIARIGWNRYRYSHHVISYAGRCRSS